MWNDIGALSTCVLLQVHMEYDVSEEDVEGENECFALQFANMNNEDAMARKRVPYSH